MPKIQLQNNESGKMEDFEPVDAREVLSDPDSIYSVPGDATDQIGLQLSGSANADVNIPQMQGGDEEMQTGLSIEKYGRAAVVKAVAGNPEYTGARAANPRDTLGRPIVDRDAKEVIATDNMKLMELREALTQKGVEIPANAKKADLQKLLDASNR